MKTNCGFLGLFAISWGFFLNWGTSSPPSAAIRGNRGLCRETGSAHDRERQICTSMGSRMPLEGAAASKAQPGFGTGPGTRGWKCHQERPAWMWWVQHWRPSAKERNPWISLWEIEMRGLAVGIPQLSFRHLWAASAMRSQQKPVRDSGAESQADVGAKAPPLLSHSSSGDLHTLLSHCPWSMAWGAMGELCLVGVKLHISACWALLCGFQTFIPTAPEKNSNFWIKNLAPERSNLWWDLEFLGALCILLSQSLSKWHPENPSCTPAGMISQFGSQLLHKNDSKNNFRPIFAPAIVSAFSASPACL